MLNHLRIAITEAFLQSRGYLVSNRYSEASGQDDCSPFMSNRITFAWDGEFLTAPISISGSTSINGLLKQGSPITFSRLQMVTDVVAQTVG